MSNFKKLISIIAPMIIALLLAVLVLYGPFCLPKSEPATVEKAATSLSANVLRGEQLKDQALDSGYLMIMGSSELLRFDSFHPSVLTHKYQRGYQPFLLGSAGTQSLTHFFSAQAMGKHLNHKRVVVIISPQWFVKKGVDKNMFDYYYSKQQATHFIRHANPHSEADRYAAQRLLSMPSGRGDEVIESSLKNIASGQKISANQKFLVNDLKSPNLSHQDQLFTRFFIKDRRSKIDEQSRVLPNKYNQQQLNWIAGNLGKEHSTNNSFQIDNRFYDRQLKHALPGLMNSQQNYTYEYGPEFSDFQLLLNQFKKHNVTPLFVIPPINSKWMVYTGLRQSMLNDFDKKITYQLKTQGFDKIVDLHTDGDVPYFMQDTIHLGWRGWVKVDQELNRFVKQKQPQRVHYHLRDYFYTKDWQQRVPATIKKY
ncbi:D-alanyl-lipoteichoic acid biosynthesis protein DltD [Bombilactobacillus folatiphilus]|uniref:Protein DltD n=1 Tax=Bombilactobacillus folatiphilus TaxID=2923362 RepID=A0ABY4P9Z8_9LACO|nr:D-alanyl-lipoteichoic acid biosynthesis protein DltD [Bombilactobacillus folatiphilus]UQS82466.1 D-alanyl-lipoteichoic acid biosynthesis protein DltD [Bombilactobacillus folatiphilus]